MSKTQIQESVALFYKEGTSDKEYRMELREVNGLWMTLGFNGRRGGRLTEQKKTPVPVEYAVAKAAYDSEVKKKMKKGYTTDVSGEVYQSLPGDREFSGFVPQLLNPIRTVESVESKIHDSKFWAQEKHDGERRPILVDQGKVTGLNKEGLTSGLPMNLVTEVLSLGCSSLLLDGEVMGERYVAFDVLEANGDDLRSKSYQTRLNWLEALLSGRPLEGIELVHTARTASEKRQLLNRLRAHGGEGIVFKEMEAGYSPARPASGGAQIKYKFMETCSVRVASHSKAKRSVELEGLADDLKTPVALGKVTIPPNMEIPAVGALVNVEYLYRYPTGALFQTVFKGVRTDQSMPDNLSKLKVKSEHAYRVDTDEPEVELSGEAPAEKPAKPGRRKAMG